MTESGVKKYYTIGEVSQITGIAEHVLRYWENDMKLLRPIRRAGGHRRYLQKDIDLIKRIDFLLNKKNITLSGIKKIIHGKNQPDDGYAQNSVNLQVVKDLHKDICNLLKEC